jgi:hypothetical protein
MPLGGWSDRADVAPLVELRDARTLRPASSVAVGVVGVLIGLALVVPALLAADRNWALVSVTTLGFILLWLFIVRPCAVLHAEGVRIVNPLRTVDITWPMIEEIRSRWALEIVAQGRRYTAWGVPAETRRPRGRELLRKSVGQRPTDAAVAGDHGRGTRVVARVIAAEIETLVAEDKQRTQGRTPRIVASSWDRASVGILVTGIVFCLIGFFVG